MSELPEREAFGDYGQWPGRAVLDPTGARLGEVREIYLDDATDRPEWVLVELADEGPRFVPLVDATIDDDAIRVAQGSKEVKDAPSLEPSKELTQDEERRLYSHYGLRYSEDESDSLLPAGDERPGDGGGDQPSPAPAATPGGEDEEDRPRPEAASPPDSAPAESPPAGAGSGDGSTLPTAAGGRPRLRRFEAALPAPGETSEPEDKGPMVPPRPEPVAPPPPPPPPLPEQKSGVLGKALPAGAGVAVLIALILIILRRRS